MLKCCSQTRFKIKKVILEDIKKTTISRRSNLLLHLVINTMHHEAEGTKLNFTNFAK